MGNAKGGRELRSDSDTNGGGWCHILVAFFDGAEE